MMNFVLRMMNLYFKCSILIELTALRDGPDANAEGVLVAPKLSFFKGRIFILHHPNLGYS